MLTKLNEIGTPYLVKIREGIVALTSSPLQAVSTLVMNLSIKRLLEPGLRKS
jgi:hypothetical protein